MGKRNSAVLDPVEENLSLTTQSNTVRSTYRAEVVAASDDLNGASSPDEAVIVLRWAAGIVIVALILLVVMGGIVFRDANL